MIDYTIIHPEHLVHLGLKDFLYRQTSPPYKLKYQLYSIKEAIHQIKSLNSRLIFLKISGHGGEEIKIIELIKRHSKTSMILLIGDVENTSLARKCLIKGAHGYVYSKCIEIELLTAIHTILKNEVYMPSGFRIHPNLSEVQNKKRTPQKLDFALTPREKEVLELIAHGFSTLQISEQLFISDQTVAVHRKNLFRKLAVKNVISLLKVANEKQLLPV
ncbi:MAG: response regulator transcription factor [Saprospiraceae bacterium]